MKRRHEVRVRRGQQSYGRKFWTAHQAQTFLNTWLTIPHQAGSDLIVYYQYTFKDSQRT